LREVVKTITRRWALNLVLAAVEWPAVAPTPAGVPSRLGPVKRGVLRRRLGAVKATQCRGLGLDLGERNDSDRGDDSAEALHTCMVE
jgi:hypothetical protein